MIKSEIVDPTSNSATVYAVGTDVPLIMIIILPTSTKAVGGLDTPIKAKKRRKNVKFAFRSCFSFRAVSALSFASQLALDRGAAATLFRSFLAL